MFDKIFLKRNRISDNTIDLGKLCESMIFYNQTNFLLDKFTVEQFIKLVGIEKLKEYSERGIIKLHYRNTAIGTAAFQVGTKTAFGPLVTKSQAFNLEEKVFRGFLEVTGSENKSKLNSRDFLDLCSPLEYTAGFQKILESECEDIELLKSQFKIYINSYLPQLDVANLTLEINESISTQIGTKAFVFKSNYDLNELNEKYSALLPNGHILNWSTFLLNSTESSGDINIASQYDTELYSDEKHTIYIQGRFNELIKRVSKSAENIQTFEKLSLENYKPISETINSGERTFEEFSKIIDKSIEFREWLSHLDGNHSLLNEYYDAITKESWIDKKPIKALRIGIFAGLGLLGDLMAGGIPIGSILSSASDNYLVPKLLKGWKPNQFIDTQVKPFLKEKNNP